MESEVVDLDVGDSSKEATTPIGRGGLDLEAPASYKLPGFARMNLKNLTNNLKGRIAEALVESIFREAGYTVSRLGRESQVHRLMKRGRDEFLPDFLAWRHVAGREEPGLLRLLAIEAKYRGKLSEFLRRDAVEEFSRIREQWGDLYVVFVTDDPAEGRSCFQVVHLTGYVSRTEPVTTDLAELPGLGIDAAIVEPHEALARRVFGLLTATLLIEPTAGGGAYDSKAEPTRDA